MTIYGVMRNVRHRLRRIQLAQLFDLAVRGGLIVTIGATYPLDQAAEAYRALEKRLTTGKVVLAA